MNEDDGNHQLQEPLLSEETTREEEAVNDGNDTIESTTLQDESIDSNCKKSRNITIMLWYMAIRCGGEAIWLGSVLSTFVFLIKPKNPEMIGYLSALEGIAQFVAACVAGVVADKQYSRRDTMLKLSSVIGVAASFLIVASCINTKLFLFLAIALALNGAFDGIGLTASLALFADSIQDGERSYYFTQRTLCTTGGQIFGPICGLISFYLLGDQWTVQACAKVIGGAQIILLPAFALLCFFRDDDAHYFHHRNAEDEENDLVASQDIENSNDLESDIQEEMLLRQDHVVDESGDSDDPSPRPTSCFGNRRVIAIAAAVSDVLCAVATGISIRYFTIFFVDNLKLGPVMVNILDALSFVLGGILMVGAQRLSIRWGRCFISVVSKVVGVAFLVWMMYTYTHEPHPESSNRAKWIVCSVYLLQNAFLNSTGALTRSLVMDNVPSNERAKWSALESINIFGWCGSAAIGGYLVARFGSVLPVFGVTACLQLVGTLPLAMVVALRMEKFEQQP